MWASNTKLNLKAGYKYPLFIFTKYPSGFKLVWIDSSSTFILNLPPVGKSDVKNLLKPKKLNEEKDCESLLKKGWIEVNEDLSPMGAKEVKKAKPKVEEK